MTLSLGMYTVVKLCRILSIFFWKGPGKLGPAPGIGLTVKVFAENLGKGEF